MAATTTTAGTAGRKGRRTIRRSSRCGRSSGAISSSRSSSRKACRCCSRATNSSTPRAATTTPTARTTTSPGCRGTSRTTTRSSSTSSAAAWRSGGPSRCFGAPASSRGGPPTSPGTTSRTSTSSCPATSSSSSPACPARASRRWPSTPSTPRASAATSSRCRPTPASSSARWTSPTSTSSRACRRPSRSTRSRRRATRARRSAPSPRSTTTCGCCSPASACPTARTTATGHHARRPSRSSTGPRAARGHPLPGARPGGPGPQGHLRHAARRPGQAGLRPGPHRRRGHELTDTPSSSSPATRCTPSRWSSTGWCCATASSAASPTRSRPRCAWPTAWPRSRSCPADGEPTTEEDTLTFSSTWPAPTAGCPSRSWRPATSRSTRPTARASLRRPRHPLRGRPRAGRPEPRPHARRGRHRAVGVGHSQYFQRLLERSARARHRPRHARGRPHQEAAEAAAVRHGVGKVHVRYKNRYGRTRTYNANYEGVIPYLQRRHTEAESDSQREQIEGYMREVPCPACGAPASTRCRSPSRRRAQHRRDLRPVDRRGAKVLAGLELSERDRMIAERWSRRSTPAWASCSTSASTT
jgi:hypothetical protein